jgi:hypothetical protein
VNFCVTRPAFRNDILQDEGLDIIGEGLETLRNMAADMNEVTILCFFPSHKMIMCSVLNCCDHQELDRQVPLMDEMDDKVCSL